jgi:hypothetical protein
MSQLLLLLHNNHRMELPVPVLLALLTDWPQDEAAARSVPVGVLAHLRRAMGPLVGQRLRAAARGKANLMYSGAPVEPPATTTAEPPPTPELQLLRLSQTHCSDPSCCATRGGQPLSSAEAMDEATSAERLAIDFFDAPPGTVCWSSDNWPWYWPWACDRHRQGAGQQWAAMEVIYQQTWFEGSSTSASSTASIGDAWEDQLLRMAFRFFLWCQQHFCGRAPGQPAAADLKTRLLCRNAPDATSPWMVTYLPIWQFAARTLDYLASYSTGAARLAPSDAVMHGTCISWLLWTVLQAHQFVDGRGVRQFHMLAECSWSLTKPNSLVRRLYRELRLFARKGTQYLTRFCDVKYQHGLSPASLVPDPSTAAAPAPSPSPTAPPPAAGHASEEALHAHSTLSFMFLDDLSQQSRANTPSF